MPLDIAFASTVLNASKTAQTLGVKQASAFDQMLKNRLVIGIDLGGTKLLAGLADAEGNILASREEPTRHGPNAHVLDQITEMAMALARESGVTVDDIAQVMIGVPSAISPQTGLGSLSPNLALPVDRPLAALVGERLSCPIAVENDVNLAAYGEAKSVAGHDVASIVFISFGTGVGMGLVVNGALARGAFGRAGEISYLPVGAQPHASAPTSASGLFEDLVGTTGIRQRFKLGSESVAGLFTRAIAGDASALEAIDVVARDASLGLAAVQALIDPARIVVGGGIGAQPIFLERLRHHLVPLLPFDCPVEPSRFGVQAGLIGAVMLASHLAAARTAAAA
ncbi:glucokinase [Rhizobium skierniewicense]|uniref:Glucokinase n=1 Tax=Rhizobium skierniewicense TaxID=984260 RepID=A0A7W6G2W0_9HYPH|nr:ROK family protein [Rhizobium skierniewicense]MBB3946879.1 glucokinase [Rhizobium skierniewicense]